MGLGEDVLEMMRQVFQIVTAFIVFRILETGCGPLMVVGELGWPPLELPIGFLPVRRRPWGPLSKGRNLVRCLLVMF